MLHGTRIILWLAVMAVAESGLAMYDTQAGRFLQHDQWETERPSHNRQSECDHTYTKATYVPRNIAKSNRPAGRPSTAMTEALYRDGMNLYTYVASMPVIHVDPYGLNIYLIRGNNSGDGSNDLCHMKVCVDFAGEVPDEGPYSITEKLCYSYAKSGFGPNVPKTTWLGWPSLVLIGCVRGKIYKDDYSGGTIIAQKQTTSYDDDVWWAYMRTREKTEDVYSVRHNCRQYALWEFRDAPGDDVHVGPIPY